MLAIKNPAINIPVDQFSGMNVGAHF